MLEDDTLVIASLDNKSYPSIFSVADPNVALEEQIKRADNFYVNIASYNRKHQAIKFKDYLVKQRKYYDNTVKSISYERYWELLEVLPPIYVDSSHFNSDRVAFMFLVSEPISSTYYTACCKYKRKDGGFAYASKIVDRFDSSSFFNDKELDKLEGENND